MALKPSKFTGSLPTQTQTLRAPRQEKQVVRSQAPSLEVPAQLLPPPRGLPSADPGIPSGLSVGTEAYLRTRCSFS